MPICYPYPDSGNIEKTRNVTIQWKQASNACYLLTVLLKVNSIFTQAANHAIIIVINHII